MHLHRTTWAYEGPEPKSLWIHNKLYPKPFKNSNTYINKGLVNKNVLRFCHSGA